MIILIFITEFDNFNVIKLSNKIYLKRTIYKAKVTTILKVNINLKTNFDRSLFKPFVAKYL